MESDSTPTNTNGNNNGSERTGNSAPFVFAFAMIADMIVVEDAIPILPKNIMIENPKIFRIRKVSKNNKNKSTVKVFNTKARRVLKISFPKYTDVEELVS